MKKFLLSLAILCSVRALGQAGETDRFYTVSFTPNKYTESVRQIVQQPDGKYLVLFKLTETTPRSVVARFTAAGFLDNTYGVDGFSPLLDVNPVDAALQSDGKIVVVGTPYSGSPFITARNQIVIARFSAGGLLDESFGTTGKLVLDYGANSSPTAVKVLADNKILVSGYANTQSTQMPVLVRLTNTGSLDPSFANGTKTIYLPTTPYPTVLSSRFDALALQNDGKIVVAGGANASQNTLIARYSSNGDLDLSFSGDGFINEDQSNQPESVRGVAIQADGKILIGGSDGDFLVSRYLQDGTADAAFSGGRVRTDFGSFETLIRLALGTDGKIYATGSSGSLATAVYNTDGSLFTGFASGGKLLSPEYTAANLYAGLIVQNDQKILLAGTNGAGGDISLLRYYANGSPDNTFSNDAQVNTYYALPSQHPTLIHTVGSGNLVITTYNSANFGNTIVNADESGFNGFQVSKFLDNFDPDPAFGNQGVVRSALGTAYAKLVQPDGKIVVAGGGSNVTLARYNFNGTVDGSFGTNGEINADFGNTTEYAASIGRQSTGKIVVLIKTLNGATSSFKLTRYNADGTVDGTFNGGTPYSLYFGGALQIQPDDRIVIGGSFQTSPGNYDFAVARYTSNGTLDPTFSGDGVQTTDFASGKDSVTALYIQEDGKIVAGGNAVVSSKIKFAVARYNNDGSADYFFSNDGKTTVEFSDANDRLRAIRTQPDGKIVLAGGAEIAGFEQPAMALLLPKGDLDPAFDGDGKISRNYSIDDPDGAQYFSSIDGPAGNMWAVLNGFRNKVSLGRFNMGTVISPVNYAINYLYFEGEWNTLPDFNAIQAVDYGTSPNFNLAARPASRADHFGFLWKGRIRLPSPGTYTFELRSDDGSKFYFNQPYNYSATPLVNNDGVHSVQSATGTVTVDTAGSYPFALAYFEGVLDETLELYWSGPGFSRQLVPASAFTDVTDREVPSTPANVAATNISSSFAVVNWDRATDNFGVVAYDVSVLQFGNFKGYTTTKTSITLDSLLPGTDYLVYIYARDAAGNRSFSGQPAAFNTLAATAGLQYRYYEGDWNLLPDFDAIKPIKAGTAANVDLAIRNRDDYFGAVWQGQIRIPVSGNYTFEIISDDGSKLYFDKLYSAQATPLIDNDGLHDAGKSATIQNVSAGLHSFALTYFEKWGGEKMQIFWSGPGFTRQPIPSSAFSDASNNLIANLDYNYYEGDWNMLPNFATLTPAKTGKTANITLGDRKAGRDDYYGFVWNGFINLPTAGVYTFETVSDDGSKFYFGHHYLNSLIPLVNNDSAHGEKSVSGTVQISSPGVYPISMTYFEKWGGETMQVYYSGPNVSRQLIPTAAFVAKPNDNVKPTAPGGIIPVGVRNNTLSIGWAQGATDDQLITGYGIYVNGVLKLMSVGNGVSTLR